MLIRLQAIWRILTSSEFFIVTTSGVTASFRKDNWSEVIRKYAEPFKDKLKESHDE
jgi:hypothetical protein